LIVDKLVKLDAFVYPTLRSVTWWKEIGNEGAFLAQDDTDFDANPSVSDVGPTVPDSQTFTSEVVQAWEKGASRCPHCPPHCGDCGYCTGGTPTVYAAPDQLIVSLRNITNPKPDGEAPFGESNFNCWAQRYGVGPYDNNYGPPFPGVPADDDCKNSGDYCHGYNGDWVLDNCGCAYIFHYPTWYEYYYPNPDPGGPPGIYAVATDDPAFGTLFTNIGSCYPGFSCDGFFIQADIIDAGGGLSKWQVYLKDTGTNFSYYYSEAFDRAECRLPRYCTRYIPFCTDFFCGWPDVIQISPTGFGDGS
jgi:hypothetical protein